MAKKSCCNCCSRKVAIVSYSCLCVFGLALLILGICLHYYTFPKMIKDKVKENVELKPGSLVYKEWNKASTPIKMQYFMFDLKNPDEFFNGSELPFLVQKGPYSYREIRTNNPINWTADNSIVTFMPNRTYVFDPESSCSGCHENDTVMTVNIPLLTMALWLKNTNYPTDHGICFGGLKIQISLLGVSLFQTKTVKEFLWGYEDPLLKFAYDARLICPAPDDLNPFVQLQYNNTYLGISAIHTGQDDIDKLEEFTMWRESDHLSYWNSPYANMLNGTDGTQFKPSITKNDTMYVFVPELCRSLYTIYDSEVTVRDIKLYRFTAPKTVYLSGDIYPDNKAFCVDPGCLPTGLLNISQCQPMNPPVVMSPPHFYESDPKLLKTVKGLHPPRKEEHATFVDIEPTTGIVMRAQKRLQVNIAMRPMDILSQTNGKFKPVFLPVMYVNESATISEDKAAQFRHDVYRPITLSKVAAFGLIAVGALLLLIFLVLLVCRIRGDEDAELTLLVQHRYTPGNQKQGYGS